MTDRICEWTNRWDALDDEDASLERCDRPARYTNCDPVNAVVCELHKCRCSKFLEPVDPILSARQRAYAECAEIVTKFMLTFELVEIERKILAEAARKIREKMP
jgi:hypothetical protein